MNGNDGKSTATPRLRFPEFRKFEGWEKRKLSTLVSLISGVHLSPDQYSKDGENPYFTGPSDFTDAVEAISKRTDVSASIAMENDTLITVKGSGVGEIWYLMLPTVALGRQLMAVRAGDSSSRFVYQFLLTKRGRFEALGSGNLIPGLSRGDILGLEDYYPAIAEQQKIADCLTSLDEVIAAQGRKVKALKAHKRGLMQQFFPREGETIPRVRFPEFEDKSDWAETTLDQLVDIQSGGTPSKANPEFWNGSIPWVSAKDMKQLYLDDSEDHISKAALDDGAKIVPVGTLLLLTRGMTLLKDIPICVLRREMTFNQDVKALRPKACVDGLFMAFLLLGNKERLLKMVDVAGHGTGKLNTDELRALGLVTPEPAEQQRIASCLSNFDAQIAAESEKLHGLKTHKKALLQQLFPLPEGD